MNSVPLPPVLILDAGQRSALAAIRSLGHRSVDVAAAAPRGHSLGGASRFVTERYQCPDPAPGVAAAREWLVGLHARLPDHVIFPATDATTLLTGDLASTSGSIVVMPPPAAYHAASDKARLLEFARAAGVATPHTTVCATRAELTDALRRLPLPLIVKPARSRVIHDNRIHSLAVSPVRNVHEAARVIETAYWIEHTPALVQEFIPGHGAGVFTLYGPNGPLAWFAHRRLREKPPSGGVSVLCESVPVDPRLQALSTRLLDALGWRGLAMVEFRIAPDGTPYLMEINARLWGSVQLAIDCGVDFPWLAYQVAIGRSVEPVTGYVVGRRLRWLLGDADNLWLQWKDPALTFGSKLRATGRFLGTFADLRARNEVFRLNDPSPAWTELQQWLRGSA